MATAVETPRYDIRGQAALQCGRKVNLARFGDSSPDHPRFLSGLTGTACTIHFTRHEPLGEGAGNKSACRIGS